MTLQEAIFSPKHTQILKPEISEIFENTTEIIDKCGPRLAGSDAAHKSARLIEEKLISNSDTVEIEPFSFHPHAFLGFMKVSAIVYVLGLVLTILGEAFLIIAFALFFLGGILTITQFVFYWKTFDRFFTTKEGRNVVATLEPRDQVKQQVIVSAHHDSAFIFNYFKKGWQKWYGFRILGATIYHYIGWAIISLFLVLWIKGIELSTGLRFSILGLMCLGLLFLVPYYNFYDKNKGSVGAGDNMISVAVGMQIMKYFHHLKQKRSGLSHTRLIFASFDGEESALRGSSAYVKKHQQELKQIPTCNINMDSLYDLKDLQFSTTDINGFCKLSKELAIFGKMQASQLGYQSKLFDMVFGGGGTDAAEFARKGIPSTTILGLPTTFVRDNIVYHTPDDTIDKIDPNLVQSVFQILLNMIDEIDHSEDLVKSFTNEMKKGIIPPSYGTDSHSSLRDSP